jgi:uncharacterized membrane-anchored protein YitT (DUF2179 family)
MIRTIFYLIIAVGCATVGLKGFVIPNQLIDGGITGISLLVSQLTNWPIGLLVFTLNLPFIYLGLRQINQVFAFKTVVGISLLAISLLFVPVPALIDDVLLAAVFGGFFLGAGIGFAIRGGGVIDGTEVLAIGLSKKISLSVGDWILILNVLIYIAAAFILGIKTALYSMITYFAAARTVNIISVGLDEYVGLHVVSTQCETIRTLLTEQLGRGATIFQAKRGYRLNELEQPDISVVFCIVTRLEIMKTKEIIHAIDPSAFIYTVPVSDAFGGMVKQRAFH